MGYLDNSGLAYLWRKLKSYVSTPTRTLTQAQYNALTEEEKQADVLYAVTDDGGSSGAGGSGCHNYSLEEQVVGQWIDGKPLYQICFQYHFSLSNQWTKHFDPIQDAVPVKLDSYLYSDPGSVESLPIYSPSSNGFAKVRYFPEEGLFSVCSIPDAQGKPTVSILSYTKTTDQATIEIPAMLDRPELLPSYPAAPQSSAAAELEPGLITKEV